MRITHAEIQPDGSIRCTVTEEREVIIPAAAVAAKAKTDNSSKADAIKSLVKADVAKQKAAGK